MEVIPAILTSDVLMLDNLLRQIRDGHKFSRVQIDFIDGQYAANTTIKPVDCDLIPYLPLKYDAHLMVVEDNILNYTKTAQKVGFDRVIAQMESISRPKDFTCLAMDVHSPVAAIRKYLPKLELVLVMSVEPGFGNQPFVEAAKGHVEELAKLRRSRGYTYRICVDGGVDKEHLSRLETMGVDEVAVGAKRVLSW